MVDAKWTPPRARPNSEPFVKGPPDPFKFDFQTAELTLAQLSERFGLVAVKTLDDFETQLKAKYNEGLLDAAAHARTQTEARAKRDISKGCTNCESQGKFILACGEAAGLRDVAFKAPELILGAIQELAQKASRAENGGRETPELERCFGPDDFGGSDYQDPLPIRAREVEAVSPREGACVIVLDRLGDGSMIVLGLEGPKGTGLPGGTVEPNETAVQAAERELYEETGLTLRIGATLQAIHSCSVETDNGDRCTGFWIDSADVEGEYRGSAEGAVVWFSPKELMENRVGKPPVRFPRYNKWAVSAALTAHREVREKAAREVEAHIDERTEPNGPVPPPVPAIAGGAIGGSDPTPSEKQGQGPQARPEYAEIRNTCQLIYRLLDDLRSGATDRAVSAVASKVCDIEQRAYALDREHE